MLKFHASIHGGVPTAPAPLSVTFEQALAALERLDRLFIEPDGSFVWRGRLTDGGAWQVDGNLLDRGDCLAYAELKGGCPTEQLDMLLAALGWPGATLIFQLPLRGEYLDEVEFRRRAASEGGAI
jgi:hypothetical protein